MQIIILNIIIPYWFTHFHSLILYFIYIYQLENLQFIKLHHFILFLAEIIIIISTIAIKKFNLIVAMMY